MATDELRGVGIDLIQRDHLHGKFLAWDDDGLVVSSFNWLATTPDPWKPSGAEIGVLVRGRGIVNAFEEKVTKALERAALAAG